MLSTLLLSEEIFWKKFERTLRGFNVFTIFIVLWQRAPSGLHHIIDREPHQQNTRSGSRKSRVREARSGALVQTPGGFARGGTVHSHSWEASSRAKRGSERSEAAVPPSLNGGSTEAKLGSTEAPPSDARPREGHREVAITKKLKKVPPETSPGEPLTFSGPKKGTGCNDCKGLL